MIQQKPTFDIVTLMKPGNGAELTLYKNKLALNRNLNRSKGLTDCHMPAENFEKLRLALSQRNTLEVMRKREMIQE